MCFRTKHHLIEHIMADLRMEDIIRLNVKYKICVFICIASKTIHLNLIKGLSAVAFLQGQHQFICTKRMPQQFWSDNATNFVGAKNEFLVLMRLFLSDVHTKAVFYFADNIEWRFIPPRITLMVFGKLWALLF